MRSKSWCVTSPVVEPSLLWRAEGRRYPRRFPTIPLRLPRTLKRSVKQLKMPVGAAESGGARPKTLAWWHPR